MAPVNARLTLAKNVSAMTAKADAFAKAVEAYKTYNEETINETILEIEQKQKELEDLDKQYKTKEIDEKIRIDQEIKRYGYDAAIKLIQTQGKIAIAEDEYNLLLEDYEKLRSEKDQEIENIKQDEKAKHKKELSAIISNMELKYKAEHASLEASQSQKENEIQLLKQTITNLTSELAHQRELTKEVAIASKQGAIQQSFGKA